MHRLAATAIMLVGVAVVAASLRLAGFNFGAELLVLVPFALLVAPARTAALITGTARRAGLLPALLLGAVRSAGAACSELAAGSVLRLLVPLVELNLSVAALAACINLRNAAISARGLCAQVLAQRGAIAATLSAQVLPAPRAAAHTARGVTQP